MTDFVLHPQLRADTLLVRHLDLSDLLLMNDERFPWLILVPRVVGASEMFDLPHTHQQALQQEVMLVASQLKFATKADKINIAALGNQVPQLHVHIIARFKTDAAWPKPVWGLGSASAYSSIPEWAKSIGITTAK